MHENRKKWDVKSMVYKAVLTGGNPQTSVRRRRTVRSAIHFLKSEVRMPPTRWRLVLKRLHRAKQPNIEARHIARGIQREREGLRR